MPVLPATWEAKVGQLLEPRGKGCGKPRLRHCTPAWATRAKLHLKQTFKKKQQTDLVRLIHYHRNSNRETTHMIQLSPFRSLPQHVGIMGATIQNET